VGDAAHLTNTRGGMNMNAGIHDAATLADTLAAIDAGGAEDALLAAWAEARAGVAARALLPRSDRAVSDARWIAHVRAEAADPARARQFLIAACMLDIARIGAPLGGSLA